MADPKAILIEDNKAVLDTLQAALGRQYDLMVASRAEDGLRLIRSEAPELIVLDLNLPDKPGLQVCQEVRQIGVKAPMLVLSGDGRLSTKLELFSAGADDYMVKPFSLGELEARLRAMTRRLSLYKNMLVNPRTTSLALDRESETVSREGSQPIPLRHKEYAILDYMVKHAGQTISRQQLTTQVWQGSSQPWSNSVDVHIKSLRDKIDRPFTKRLLTTIHGSGYRLEDA